MAKRVGKAPAKGSGSNPYKLQRVTPEEPKVKEKYVRLLPPPHFSVGDTVVTIFKPLFYEITEPIIVRGLRESHSMVSGWLVSVDTSSGLKDLDSGHFKRLIHEEPF